MKHFITRFLQDLLAGAKSKLSALWKSSKLIILYSDAPQPAKVTGLTSIGKAGFGPLILLVGITQVCPWLDWQIQVKITLHMFSGDSLQTR